MTLTYFKSRGKNQWDINVSGSKKGRIEKRCGSFVAILTRNVELPEMNAVTFFVAELNNPASSSMAAPPR